jgi:hypothetical protein
MVARPRLETPLTSGQNRLLDHARFDRGVFFDFHKFSLP